MVARRRGSIALLGASVLLLLAGLAASYVKRELAEPGRFADRAVRALRAPEVRAVIAEELAVEVLERRSPELVASRPLVLTAVEAVLQTDQFARVLRRSAIAAHEVLLRGDRDVIVELEEAGAVLAPALRSASPELARRLPRELSPRIAEIRGSDAATWAVRVSHAASAAALPLLIGAVVAFGLAVALAPERRRAVATEGLLLAGGAAAGLVAMAALRAQVVAHAGQVGVLSTDDARAATGASWDALAGDLERWLLVIAIAGLAVAGGTLLAEARIDRSAALRHAVAIVAGAGLPRPVRLLRGLALAAVGALILLGAEPVLTAAVAAVGGALVLLGIADAVSAAEREARAAPGRGRGRRRAIAGGGAALLLSTVVTIALLRGGGPPEPPRSDEITACNGLPALCDRRLDEVVLAGTHNSMAAADRPGWFFANQVRPIPRQLDDGIRLLMIDPHYGVVDSRGRVRTDLQAEGTSRNRVAREVGAEAVGVAERLAGRLGLVPSAGEREVYLCHTLCELGAEPIDSTLDEIRGFLERNPFEVIVVFVESSIDAADLERELEQADLAPYLATLRRAEPLPTLRELIASGRRLVVLDQGDGGAASWYQPGFLFLQETRVDSLLDSPTACDPGRGSPESPLFLLNHWIDRFPPPPSANRAVSERRTLLNRVRRCREVHGRLPNLIAVDFYEQGDAIAVARELSRSLSGSR
jgi:hypothetical protein